MSFKSLLVFLDEGKSNADRVDAAIQIAKTHDAHLTGVSFGGLLPEALRSDNDNVIELKCKRLSERLIDEFKNTVEKTSLKYDSYIIPGNSDDSANSFAHHGRNADLIILAQPDPDSRNYKRMLNLSEETMLLSGRPIMFMPYIGANKIPFRKALISWDGTPAATRATYDSIPLLRLCEEVTILVVHSKKQVASKKDVQAEDLSVQLARHGITAKVLEVSPGDAYVASVILNEVSHLDIDLLIMGGYGTPTLKQKIMGGVTSSLLSTMLTPVVMSH
jgi:nucleotide-binding universal stress UspA family protein